MCRAVADGLSVLPTLCGRSPLRYAFTMVRVAGELLHDDYACLTCAHVLNGSPVHLVVRDADGEWQFLCSQTHDATDARVIGLGEAVAIEPRLSLLAPLSFGESTVLRP